MLNWFEISVSDFERAKAFYTTVFEFTMDEMEMNGLRLGFFPPKEGKSSGAIVKGEWYTPSSEGALLYLFAGEDLTETLGRVEPAGGHVVLPKTQIGEWGFIAIFIDSEGNKVGLQSAK